MSWKPFLRLLSCCCLILGTACGGGGGGSEASASLPVIQSFQASPSTITAAQSVTLTWEVSGADTLAITPGPGTVTGTQTSVLVSATTTFTLTARNSHGERQASATVSLVPTGTVRIILLRHSTGGVIWDGGVSTFFTAYNTGHGTHYQISERAYPNTPYPWENYPYDYWNLWVNPSGPADDAQSGVHSLAKLCQDYDVIIFKHCYPVSGIEADTGTGSVSSSAKRAENYKLQYAALKSALNAHPDRKFILWTGAALRESASTAEQGARARAFFQWVKGTWDVPGDNIYLWDFFELETEGTNFLLPANAAGDSHPGTAFATRVAPLLGQRVVDVIEGRGDSGSLTGE